MITNLAKDALGWSFDAKFPGMRKPQEFVVYPATKDQPLLIQSDTRIGYIYKNGRVELTKSFPGGAFQPDLAMRRYVCILSDEALLPLEKVFK